MYIMHYRKFDKNGQLMPKGGITFAIHLDAYNNGFVSIARCSNKDVFSRKLGRTIAEGRMNSSNKENLIEITVPEGLPVKSFVDGLDVVQEEVDKLYL
jgi:hypothetical protein